MQALIGVILPVFLVLGAGYLATRLRVVSDDGIDHLMQFAQGIAVPCLLFLGVADLDLGQTMRPGLFAGFYGGALAVFAIGGLGAHYLFRRPGPDSVAIGFTCFFSNTLLLGLPITERAYGADALSANLALIAVHSPTMYVIGIAAMETVKSHGQGLSVGALATRIGRGLLRNPLVIGIGLGFAANLTGVPVTGSVRAAVEMIGSAALPAALFGLGGVLVRYRPEGDLRIVSMVIVLALVIHPAVTYFCGKALMPLSVPDLRSATLTAAMPPGINAYLFAHMYGVGKKVAATSVLVGTAVSVLTIWVWLGILP